MFRGSIVALITPMDRRGKICPISLKRLIDYHIKSGTSAIVISGTTGESATLTDKERHNVILLTLELADNRIPVIAGTGSCSTSKGVILTQNLENTGLSGCLTITPYYNCPTQEGLYHHFREIATSTNLPQILYNIPSRTGTDLLPVTIQKLAQIKNIVGIKEATGDLSRVSQLKSLIKSDFILLSGHDSSALDFMQLGGHGVVSVTSNIAASEMFNLCDLAKKNKFLQARSLNERLSCLYKKLFIEPNPIPVKWAAKRLGLIETDMLRLPMTPLTQSSCMVLERALQTAGLL
ncbi:4-hydroxy-tetrahydrodipicolinate synthase [Candidatus Erwinia haradaeae]|uniref:4-hydroxy-tetrahydrodipicolinate synthase n=1 Tax=Candidatus Erwinia haradaeae TaxID=1922217 RepID=A0A451D7C3_9GAMM|nr:4-hydroxy-tetrahydrodipicolinate synthase [Candidatus Erwinia haradaeae]VFP81728.1 4-hydroxy-tetrahydrodipicolinate synthase [Candidatus Erwinia haradaeae]